ncbi:MAG TPA: 2Fe-2S iron-sulfur cluster binding domain-containing protein [Bacteroidetes bacterium]|nr:2Fe-2S iron-sulfur cluster binding domain-containing protein [Bacteroidota bacterium]
MIQFILNEKLIRYNGNSGITLLKFIRDVENLKGTKAGCKEGDCGACTVLSGSLTDDGHVEYQSITSCLTPLANVQGKHIVTVEGQNLEGELNVAQQAIKDNFATQCGFCTPGFIVSLTGVALRDKKIDYDDVINSISGNICRCTGYKSIEKAALDVEKTLEHKDLNNNIDWLIDNNFIPAYFREIPERLKKMKTDINKTGEKIYVGGGTDIYVRYADDLSEKNVLPVRDLVPKGISFENNRCIIGANTTVTDLVNNGKLYNYFPELFKYLKLVSSEQIRNMGTIAGNFVNASPIGDMSIFFLALNSKLLIKKDDNSYRKIFLKDFFIDYKKFDLGKDELIYQIEFDLPDKNTYFNFEKVSKRTHLDIASVNTAINIKMENNKVKDIHISIGGVLAIPKYLGKTRDFLIDKTISTDTIKKAVVILQSEISPINDIRGTIEYKRLLARQLFYAHFMEIFPMIFEENSFFAKV